MADGSSVSFSENDKFSVLNMSSSGETQQVVVVDTTVEGYEQLVAGIDGNAEIILVGEGGLSELADALDGYENIASLQILSHGDVGTFYLGGDEVTADTLSEHAELLAKIGARLSEGGDILLLGCQVGEGDAGLDFIEAIAEVTGADVAASDDLTGASSLGGDWDLEVTTGDVEEELASWSAESMESFEDVLVPVVVGTVDFGASVIVLASDSAGPVANVDGSGLTITYSGNTDAVDMAVANPSDAWSGTDSNFGGGSDWTGKTLMFGHVVGFGVGLAASPQLIDYVSFESDNGTDTFDLDGFVIYYRGDGSLTFDVTAHDSSGAQIGSAVTLNSFTETTEGGYTAGYMTVSDGTLGSDFDEIVEFRVTPSSNTDIGVIGFDNIVLAAPPANNAPVLTGLNGTPAFTEDSSAVVLDSDVTVADSELDALNGSSGDYSGASLTIARNGGADSNDVFGFSDGSVTLSGSNLQSGGQTFATFSQSSGTLTISFTSSSTTATSVLVDAVLQSITYSNSSDTPDASVQLDWTFSDGTDTDTGSTTVSITNVNDNPEATGIPSDISFTEDTEGNVDLSAVTVSDPDSASITVTLTASEGVFGTPADGAGVGGGVTESKVSDTVITLTGSPTDITTYLGTASNIKWTSAQDDSGNDTSSITVTANDGDGSGDVALDTINLDVTAVNDSPTATGSVSDFAVFEETAGNIDLSGIDFTDVDSAGTVSVTLTASSGTLAGTTGGGVTESGSGTSELVLTGTFAAIETFLDDTSAVRYTGASDVSGDDAATLTVVANDDDGSGDVTLFTSNIDITDINDEPTLTATGTNPSFTEDGGAVDLFSTVTADTIETGQTFSAFTITVTNVADTGDEILNADGTAITLDDSESGTTATNSLSYSVSVSSGTATISFSGGTMSEAAMQTLVDGMTYDNDSDDPTTSGNRVVTITSLTDSGPSTGANDDTASLSIASTVTITAVNDAPVITNVNGDSSSVVAGAGATDVTLFNDATVADDDSGNFDGGFVEIVQNTGTANGSWSVDGTIVTSGGDATVSGSETVQVNGVTIGVIDASDDGQGGNDLTINLSANANSDTVETLLQNLNYSGPSIVEARSFTLTLNDADGTASGGDQDTTANFTINVTPNPPVFSNIDGDSHTFTEGDGAIYIDANGDVTISDADSSNFDGGDLDISYTANQAADDRLEIDTSGSVSLSAGMTSGSVVSVSGTAIGSIDASATGGSGEDLTISLTANATPDRVETLLQAIQYNNDGDDNPTDGDRTIEVTLSDGSGGTSTAATITVNVDPVNDAPTVSGQLSDYTVIEDVSSNLDLSGLTIVDEDTTGDVTLWITASDGDFGTLGDLPGLVKTVIGGDTVKLVGNVDTINSFLDNEDYIPYTGADDVAGDDAATFTVSINDGEGSGNVDLFTSNIDITNVNDLPTSTGGDETVVEEETLTFAAADFNFADVDSGDTLASVRIDTLPAIGTLELNGSPISASAVIAVGDIPNLTYVAPASVTTTSFTYSVNDGTGFAASTATMDITIESGNAAPENISLDNTSVTEELDGAWIGRLSATDVEGEDITFTVNDARFYVTSGDVLKLKAGESLDFETEPTVTVRVTATDTAGKSSTKDFTITVKDVGEMISGDDATDDTLTGGSANDTLGGGNGRDTLDGGDGDDSLDGGSDDDFLTGGEGQDTLKGGIGQDTLGGGNGRDTIDGGEGDDTIGGGSDDDLLTGGDGDDTVDGGDGQDTLRGGEGDDDVISGAGNDLVFAGIGDLGSDSVSGDQGDDTLGGGIGDDMIDGDEGSDLLWGETGNDTISGGDGDDLLYNGEGTDVADGGAGNDTLWAGSGDDTLIGGSGDDVFVFGAISGNDQILDFDVEDDQLFLTFSGSGLSSLQEIEAVSTETTVDGNSGVLIQLTESSSVFIVGINLSNLSEIDFQL